VVRYGIGQLCGGNAGTPIVHFCNRRTVEWRHSRTSVGQEFLGVDLLHLVLNECSWVRDARNSQAEVDFVYKFKSRLLPIEVR